jgi:hypothetical protein
VGGIGGTSHIVGGNGGFGGGGGGSGNNQAGQGIYNSIFAPPGNGGFGGGGGGANVASAGGAGGFGGGAGDPNTGYGATGGGGAGMGGAIFVRGGLLILSSTFQNNSAVGGTGGTNHGGQGLGGAVFVAPGAAAQAVSAAYSSNTSDSADFNDIFNDGTNGGSYTQVGLPASLAINGSSSLSAQVSGAFGPLQVTVRDSSGNPILGVPVTFSAPSFGPSGTFSNGASSITVFTNNSGVATASLTANAYSGVYRVTAAYQSLSAAYSLTNNATAAGSYTASGTPQSEPINSLFASALGLQLADPYGYGAAGLPVTFTVSSTTSAGATFYLANPRAIPPTSYTVNSDSTGYASVLVSANGNVGSYLVTATVPGISGTINFSLTNTPGVSGTPGTVDAAIRVTTSGFTLNRTTGNFVGTITLTNTTGQTTNGPFSVVFNSLPSNVTLVNASGTFNGSPYLSIPMVSGLVAGESVVMQVQFSDPSNVQITFTPVAYTSSQ